MWKNPVQQRDSAVEMRTNEFQRRIIWGVQPLTVNDSESVDETLSEDVIC